MLVTVKHSQKFTALFLSCKRNVRYKNTDLIKGSKDCLKLVGNGRYRNVQLWTEMEGTKSILQILHN